MHRFEWISGKLHHFFNDELLAVIPAESIVDYQAAYPDAPDQLEESQP